jgi:cell division protein ZapA
MSNETITVRILDKEYQVACPADERQALLDSAHLLNERMKAIRGSSSLVGLERMAVMAALNLSHELLQARQATGASANQADLQRLHDKIDKSLQNFV